MSIRARLEYSRFLHAARRYEGAVLSLLIAVAATSRKRYPKGAMGDAPAFKKFFHDEMQVITGNVANYSIKFRGKLYPL